MVHSSGSRRDTQLYFRLLAYVAPYRLLFLVSIIAMVVLAAADAAKAALMKPMLDGAFIEKDPELMITVPLYLVGLFVISGIAAFISSFSLLVGRKQGGYGYERTDVFKAPHFPKPILRPI